MELKTELPLPSVTVEQRVKFAILCAQFVCKKKSFNRWAENWLSGKDRTADTAAEAGAAAELNLIELARKAVEP